MVSSETVAPSVTDTFVTSNTSEGHHTDTADGSVEATDSGSDDNSSGDSGGWDSGGGGWGM